MYLNITDYRTRMTTRMWEGGDERMLHNWCINIDIQILIFFSSFVWKNQYQAWNQHLKILYKVEGAKTNTPSKTNTYKRLPIANTLQPWTVPGGVGVSRPTGWQF